MANELTTTPAASELLRPAQVYAMAAVCLALGLAIGYLFRGSASVASSAPAASAALLSPPGGANVPSPATSLEEMKQAADKQVAPLLDRLKSDPNNGALLIQVGAIYQSSHQFKQAAAYYDKAVQVDPSNVALRTKLAASLYRTGDVDGAIAQLNRALSYDPKDANSLFDLGVIRLQGKGDGAGALAAWQQLLKLNPQLSEDRKATVQTLMADVLTTMGERQGGEQQGGEQHGSNQHGMKGAQRNGGHQ